MPVEQFVELDMKATVYEGTNVALRLITGMQNQTEDGWVPIDWFTPSLSANQTQKKTFNGLLRYVRWEVTSAGNATFLVNGVARGNRQFYPTDVDGCVLWLRADTQVLNGSGAPAASGDAVQTWNDRSNAGNNAAAAQGTLTYQTGGAGGAPYLNFTGSQALSVANPATGSLSLSAATVAVIVSNVNLTSAPYYVSKGQNGGSFDYSLIQSTTNAQAGYNNITQTGPAWTPTAATASLNITTFGTAATNWYIDGALTAQTGQTNVLSTNTYALLLGANVSTVGVYSSFLTGRLYEVMVFNRVITADEAARLYGYKQRRYGS